MKTRQWIGSLVLIAGTGGLFWAAWAQAAPRIEAAVAGAAETLAQDTAVVAQVSGRDVILNGTAVDAAERAALRERFSAASGVRVVDVSGVDLLPVADPFEIVIRQEASGLISVVGVLPSEAARETLQGSTGALFDGASLAAGVPDDRWVTALQVGMDAFGGLSEGTLILSNRVLTLRGEVATPDAYDALIAPLADLPEGYVFDDQIDVLDDGAPLRLVVTKDGEMIEVAGKLPADFDIGILTDRFGSAATSDIVQARIPADDAAWPAAAITGLDALSQIIDGQLVVEGRAVTLTGQGSPDGIAAAEASLAALPAQFTAVTDLSLWDDGVPLRLTMDWDGSSATASGKYPAGFTPRGPAAVAVTNDGRYSFRPDDAGAFTTNADTGVAALGLLTTGALIVTEDRITVTGTAASPQIESVMDSVLARAAPGTTINASLNYLDDGSPASWVLTYTADNGAEVTGRLPAGLRPADMAAALGLEAVGGAPATAVEDTAVGPALDVLTIASGYLPELEALTLSRDGSGTALDLIVAPGVDIDLVATDLAQRLPGDVAFSISPGGEPPEQGSLRTNAATGLREVYLDGFWIPDLNFTTTADGCDAQTRAILEGGRIGFLSGSARLDATSIRTINALAAVAVPCVEADLELEVAGHTDASGDADQNQILSQDRAEAVRDALIARGVPPRAITAIGFGQTQPIATNDTPEGRTANRRTDIAWFEKDALRDP